MSFVDQVFGLEGRWLMGTLVPHKFLGGLESHLSLVAEGRERAVVAAIDARARELVEANTDMVVDGASKGMLGMSAVVLAGYDILRPEMDDDGPRTILFLQHVFNESLSRSVEIVVHALASRDDPLDVIEKAIRKASRMYGAYFDFRFDRPDADNFEMRIERCFFRDFFARYDALIVTTVLCAFDAAWMQALDPAVSRLHSERTSLLSLGDDACRFRVHTTSDPMATPTDVIERRFEDLA